MRISRRTAASASALATFAIVAAASCAFPDFPFADADAGIDGDTDSGRAAPDASPGTDAPPTGACTHDCLGGACLGGVCQPVTLNDEGDAGPGGIYVNDLGVVYFTQYYGGRVLRGQADGSVSVVADKLRNPVRAGGSAQRTFATVFGETDAAAARILSFGSTGNATAIVTGPTVAGLTIAPWGIVDTGKLIVWTNAIPDGSVMLAAQNGLSPSVLAVGGRPQELAANAQFAWWIDGDGSRLFRAPLTGGGGGGTLVTSDFVDFVAYAGGHLFTASAVNTSSIGVIDDPMATGTAVRELVSRYVTLPGSSETAVHAPHGIAVDDTHIYWVNGATGSTLGSVVRTRLDGSGAPELLAGGIPQPDQIALTSAAIYWTTFTGRVQRLAKP